MRGRALFGKNVHRIVVPSAEKCLVRNQEFTFDPGKVRFRPIVVLVDLTSLYECYGHINTHGIYRDAVHQTAEGYANFAMALWFILKPQ